jgi:hypothetical protein
LPHSRVAAGALIRRDKLKDWHLVRRNKRTLAIVFLPLIETLEGNAMNLDLKSVSLVAAIVLSATSVASAQGGMTDRNGNSTGSAGVSSTGAPMRDGKVERGTVGMSGTVGMGRDVGSGGPNGSASDVPTNKAGPVGDPSRDAGTPK